MVLPLALASTPPTENDGAKQNLGDGRSVAGEKKALSISKL